MMENLEQFNSSQEYNRNSETWESKKKLEDVVKLEQELVLINKEISQLEHPRRLSYVSKVLHTFTGNNNQNKLIPLYQKRHSYEAMLEKLCFSKSQSVRDINSRGIASHSAELETFAPSSGAAARGSIPTLNTS